MNPFGREVQENWIVVGGLEVVLEHLLASDGPLTRLYISGLSLRNSQLRKNAHDQILVFLKVKIRVQSLAMHKDLVFVSIFYTLSRRPINNSWRKEKTKL